MPQDWDKIPESRGGSKMIRHEANDKTLGRKLSPLASHALSPEEMDLHSAHLERHVGPVASVFHEMLSDDLHIDINLIQPNPKSTHNVLCTMGMSGAPMHLPPGYDAHSRIELFTYLPPNWPLTEQAFKQFGEDAYWPIHWLKNLARLPNDYQTFLDAGHTVPHGDPPAPLSPRCKFTGFAIVGPLERFPALRTPRGEVAYYLIMPTYAEELQLKLDEGFGALLDRLDNAGIAIEDLANPKRPNVALSR